jgi:hypothetical protein
MLHTRRRDTPGSTSEPNSGAPKYTLNFNDLVHPHPTVQTKQSESRSTGSHKADVS